MTVSCMDIYLTIFIDFDNLESRGKSFVECFLVFFAPCAQEDERKIFLSNQSIFFTRCLPIELALALNIFSSYSSKNNVGSGELFLPTLPRLQNKPRKPKKKQTNQKKPKRPESLKKHLAVKPKTNKKTK